MMVVPGHVPGHGTPPMALHLLRSDDRSHVSTDTVEEFYDAILASGGVKTVMNRYSRFPRVMGRLLRTRSVVDLLRRLPGTGGGGYFSVLMSADFVKCVPYFFASRNNAVYMFDAWPDLHPVIREFLPKLNITAVFFSSRQVTEEFNREGGNGCRFVWIPEGIDPARYRSRPPGERDIDVLQFGRRYDAYHGVIVKKLREAGKTYLFEKTRGAIVFPGRGEFIDGLSRAKISICIPGNVTHPGRSGEISTMTIRYLQSMASGCLIVGMLPDDMKTLFDYNPLVEIDGKDPAGQLLGILDTMERYAPLIERNQRTIRERHTWTHRWRDIRQTLEGAE
jgi:hypothetical protein